MSIRSQPQVFDSERGRQGIPEKLLNLNWGLVLLLCLIASFGFVHPDKMSPEALDVLRRVQAVGEVANLIVTFGPHAGETLGQVAQSDPDYVRRLALSAQRPAVRAAAAQVVSALGEPAAPPRRPRAGWRRASNSAR